MMFRKIAATLLLAALIPAAQADGRGAGKQESGKITFSWSRSRMDGSRTGVTCPGADNVNEALGRVDGRLYRAPNGKTFKGGSVPEVASVLIGVQPAMAPVKKVVGHSAREMIRTYPECELSNLFIDTIMAAVEKESGRKVDVGIGNFGGIRVDMPAGDILQDDIMSMFPFKNDIVYVALKGRDVRAILDRMAAGRFEVLGGVRVVAEDGKIVSAEIGGEPLDDEKVYGVATITFLLDGGDDVHVAKNALEVIVCGKEIYDVMMDYVKAETAAGRPVEYHKDGRVQIL